MKSRGIGREKTEEDSFPGKADEIKPEVTIVPDCPERKKDCFAYRSGKCIALERTGFKNGICPFYKEKEEARQERIASMEKLEQTGRLDLIRLYYKNELNFDQILADEMIGISYEFDPQSLSRRRAVRRKAAKAGAKKSAADQEWEMNA